MLMTTGTTNRGRPKKTVRNMQLNISLPEDMAARVKLHLWSELEGKVPHGAQAAFFEQLVRDFFNEKDRGL